MFELVEKLKCARAFWLALCLTCGVIAAHAQQPGTPATVPFTPAPSGNSSGQAAPNASSNTSNTTTVAPSANTPPATSGGAPQNARPLTPSAQAEQSQQAAPQTQQQQNTGTPTQPASVFDIAPTSTLPTQGQDQSSPQPSIATPNPNAGGSAAGQTNVTPAAPVPVISSPQTNRPPGRESVAAPAPELLPNVPQIAPNFRANPNVALPEIGRVGVDMADARPLSLREAIALALENNKDIEVARQNVRLAEFDLESARGIYDPRLSSLSYYEKTETPSSSFLSGGSGGSVSQSSLTGTGRFEGLVPKFGGGYRVDFSTLRLTTDNQFAALNPQYPTALTFSYTQPLLRGLRFDQNRRSIEIGKRNLSLTDAQFRQRAIETITTVQRAYWDLVFNLRNLQIQRDAVRDARIQLEHNRRLVAEGILAPIDVVAAEAQVSGFEQSIYTALEDVGRSENLLKNLFAENRNAAVWTQALLPTDAVDLELPQIELPEAINLALSNRPELKQSDAATAINEIDRRFYREQTRPQLDLVGSYGVVGLAGTLNPSASSIFGTTDTALRNRVNELSRINNLPVLPDLPVRTSTLAPELLGGIGQSFSNLFANRFNNFRFGVQVNLPLRNRTAEAQLGRSLVEGERIKTQREQLEQLIQVDVRNALQTVRTSESRLRAAAASRSASEQQYQSEQRKFDIGQSTLFLVLERQTALTTARGNELRAQTELNKAIAELQRATGNALEANRVSISVR